MFLYRTGKIRQYHAGQSKGIFHGRHFAVFIDECASAQACSKPRKTDCVFEEINAGESH